MNRAPPTSSHAMICILASGTFGVVPLLAVKSEAGRDFLQFSCDAGKDTLHQRIKGDDGICQSNRIELPLIRCSEYSQNSAV
jgi:hypothetical protein